MANEEETLHALGICAKAGGLVIGTPMVCDALASGKPPRLVLSACDNSENTAKRLSDRCAYYGARLVVLTSDGVNLSRAIGKHGKTAAVAVRDENLCRLVMKSLGE